MRKILCISVLLGSIVLSCQGPTVRMDGFAVHGIDVSHYQALIDWDTVAEQDIHFAFVKATEGITLNDSLYCRNWDHIKRAGIYRGAYHFFRPSFSAEDQARNFMQWVELEVGDLPPVLDVEVLDGVSKARLITGVKTWLFLTEIHYNVKPIIYTNLKFYNKYLAGHFNDYPLWIARYNSREPTLANGSQWRFWQYGNRGRLAGIDGNVDFNVFAGTLEELEHLCVQPAPVLSGLSPYQYH